MATFSKFDSTIFEWTDLDKAAFLLYPVEHEIRKRSHPVKYEEEAKYEFRSSIALGILLQFLEASAPEFYIACNVDGFGRFGDVVVKYRSISERGIQIMKMLLINCDNSKLGITNDLLVKLNDDHQDILKNVGNFADSFLNDCKEENIDFMLCFSKLRDEEDRPEVLGENNHNDFRANNRELFQKLIIQNIEDLESEKESLKNKLKKYISNSEMSLNRAYYDAIEFIINSKQWLNRFSKFVGDFIINLQGTNIPVKELETFFNIEILEKILVHYICGMKVINLGSELNQSSCKFNIERNLTRDIEKERMVFFYGERGIGKTTFLNQAALKIKKQYPNKWIIREDIKKYSNFVSRFVLDDKENNGYKLLTTFAGVYPNSIGEYFFHSWLQRTKDIVVLLDGVDDLEPKYFDKMINLLSELHKIKDLQIWITGTRMLEREIRDRLRVKTVSLPKFSMDNIQSFISIYCNSPQVKIDNEDIYLLKNPLLCQMFGNKLNSTRKEDILPSLKKQISIYEEFMDIQHDVLITDSNDVSTFSNLKMRSINNFKIAAVIQIFREPQHHTLRNKLGKEIEQFLYCQGRIKNNNCIIEKIVGDIPVFRNISLAKYLAACWVVEQGNDSPIKRSDISPDVLCFIDIILKNIKVFDLPEDKNIFNDVDFFKTMILKEYALTMNDISYYLKNLSLSTDFNAYLVALWLDEDIMAKENNVCKYWLCLKDNLSIILSTNKKIFNYSIMIAATHCLLHRAIYQENAEKVIEVLNSGHCCKRCKDSDYHFTPLEAANCLKNNKIIKILLNDNVHRRNHSNCKFDSEIINDCTINVRNQLQRNLNSSISIEHFRKKEKEIMGNVETDSFENVIATLLECAGSLDGLTVLHIAARCSTDYKLFHYLIKIRRCAYKKDDKGFYPHDYAEGDLRLFLKGFGFTTGLSMKSRKEREIYGLDILDLVKQCNHGWFNLGINYVLKKNWYLTNDLNFESNFGKSILRYYYENDSSRSRLCSFLLAKWLHYLIEEKKVMNVKDTLCRVSLPQVINHLSKLYSTHLPLHMAILEGNDERAKMLIENGAATNTKNAFKWTPLHIAICVNNEPIQELLLPKINEFNYNSLMHHVVGTNYRLKPDGLVDNHIVLDDSLRTKILRREYDCYIFKLHYLVSKGNLAHLEPAMRKVSINVLDENDRSCLHVAAATDNFEICEVLLKNKDLNYTKDSFGLYPHAYSRDPDLRNLLMTYCFKSLKKTIEPNEKYLDYDLNKLIDEVFKGQAENNGNKKSAKVRDFLLF